MADQSAVPNVDLVQICATLGRATSDESIDTIEPAVDALLEASRDSAAKRSIAASRQNNVLDSVVQYLLRQEAQQPSSYTIESKLLRCIGNLVADENQNRDVVLASGQFLDFLRTSIVFETIGDQDKQYERASLALKVAFNLCNDYEPAQQAALAAGVDHAVLEHIHTCLFISKDDTTDLGLELLEMIGQHVSSSTATPSFSKDFTHKILRLPCIEDVDEDTFLEMTRATSPYLIYAPFQEAVLADSFVPLAFELLEKAIFMLSNSRKADECRLLESTILRAITEISTLPAFPSTFASSSDFVRTLCDRCVLTETDGDSPNVAVCACILLGNFAIDPSAAAVITPQIKMDALHDFITLKAYRRSRASTAAGSQDHADYLHAAAGMLRHLALPVEIRQKFFRDEASKQTAMALAQYPRPEVQISGLRLLRQFIMDDPIGLEHALNSSYHIVMLRLFTDPTTDGRVKLEISRTITALLRELAKPMNALPSTGAMSEPQQAFSDATVSALISAPHLVDPLSYAITESKLPLAQAEGYLGLCLILRCSPAQGVTLLSSYLYTHPSLIAALRAQITGSSQDTASANTSALPIRGSKAIAGSVERKDEVADSAGEALPLQGAKTDTAVTGVAGKARDNALVLLSEMLKSEGLDDGVRDELDSIANEAGITLRL
ncbi:hypothetical protein CAC42_4275 [Sphaceloma murrayae]|uniref:Uncharacterized protein n=1 Tax=Sphaceloma murrayae TaxID=2082308 RepID=A0A2K1QLY1_9PEZI|nr:hypothetical protein CAC42_4275 [Sphaceloma murrayae]